LKSGAAALAIAAGLLTTVPPAKAAVSTATPPAPDQVRLGIQLSEEMLSVLKLEDVMSAAMAKAIPGAGGGLFTAEPKWKDFMVEAMTEEVRADHEVIVTMLGRELARQCTADELKAGAVLFRDPAMPVVFDAAMRGAQPPSDLKPQPETMKALSTPAGQSFTAKLGNLGTFFSNPESNFSRALLPGFLKRFGDKAVALERQRRLAEGLPAGG
jgi:hypothetical protein